MKHLINISKQNWHMANPSSPCDMYIGESLPYQGGRKQELNRQSNNDQDKNSGIIMR